MPGVVHLDANAVFARLVAVDAAAVVIANGECASCHVNHQSVEFGRWVAMIAFALNSGLCTRTQIEPLDGRFGLELGFKDTNRVSRHAGKDKLTVSCK